MHRAPRHEIFTLGIWDEEMMNTDADMCQLEPSWWKNGRCSRAMIEGLAPLLMKKLLLRTCLQPVLLLIAWQLSKLDSGERSDGSRQLRLLKIGPTTSGCLFAGAAACPADHLYGDNHILGATKSFGQLLRCHCSRGQHAPLLHCTLFSTCCHSPF